MSRIPYAPAILGTLLVATLLGFSPANASRMGTLYGINTAGGDSLVRIDPATGVATEIGPIGFDAVFSLAFDPTANKLYGAPYNSGQLIAIDPATGAGDVVGDLGVGSLSALAFDPVARTLYGTTGVNGPDDLVSIDVTTGHATSIGSTGLISIGGLAFDTAANTLMGVNTNSGHLITIDQTTAGVTTIGPLGFPLANLSGLAFDPTNRTLFGLDLNTMNFDHDLVTVDLATGTASAVGPLFADFTFALPGGLAFAPATVPEPSGLLLLLAGVTPASAARRRG